MNLSAENLFLVSQGACLGKHISDIFFEEPDNYSNLNKVFTKKLQITKHDALLKLREEKTLICDYHASFFTLDSGEEKLINLSKNIIAGNSIKGNKTSGYGDQEFDIIIGNPPYIPTELLSEEDREYFANHYEGLYGKYDTSIIFVEKYLNLLKKDGFLAFILPTIWQTGDTYETFRKLIFTKFKVSLSQLINLPYTVFPDAYVDTGITIFKNQKAGNLLT